MAQTHVLIHILYMYICIYISIGLCIFSWRALSHSAKKDTRSHADWLGAGVFSSSTINNRKMNNNNNNNHNYCSSNRGGNQGRRTISSHLRCVYFWYRSKLANCVNYFLTNFVLLAKFHKTHFCILLTRDVYRLEVSISHRISGKYQIVIAGYLTFNWNKYQYSCKNSYQAEYVSYLRIS